MPYIELERKQYDYIFCDKDQNIHVLLPLVGGTTVGTDNTCKTLLEMMRFWGLKDHGVSALSSVDKYIKDLETDILFLRKEKDVDKYRETIKAKNHRLAQLQEWKKILEGIFPAYQSLISSAGWSYVPEIKGLLGLEQNVVRIVLSPNIEDNVSAWEKNNALFSVKRQSDSGYYTGFGQALRNLPKRKLVNSKQLLMERSIALYKTRNKKNHPNQKIEDDSNVEQVKDCISEVYQALFPSLGFERAHLDNFSMGGKVDFQNLAAACLCEAEIPLDDAIENIIDGAIGVDKIGVDPKAEPSPFEEIDLDTSKEKELFSIRCQMFLATINAHCYALSNNIVNFGQVIEKNPLILKRFIEAIDTAAKNNIAIDNAIFQVFQDNHSIFGLAKKLAEQDYQTIQKRFRERYQTIKDSPHFDEFVFFLPERKTGCGFSHNGKIAIHFGQFLALASPELFGTHFTAEQPILKYEISSDSRMLRANNFLGDQKDLIEDLDIEAMLDQSELAPDYFVNLLLKPIELENKDPTKSKVVKCFSLFSPDQMKALKEHKNTSFDFWQKIQDGVLSKLTPEESNEFCTKWSVPPVLQVTYKMAEIIYAKVAGESKGADPLLGLKGPDKLKAALNCLKIEFTNVRRNEMGGYIVDVPEATIITEQFMPLYIKARHLFHIPRAMAKSLYAKAKQVAPYDARLERKVPDKTITELKKIDEEIDGTSGRERPIDISFLEAEEEKKTEEKGSPLEAALEVLQFRSKTTPNGYNGHWLKVQMRDQKEIDRLQDIYQAYYAGLPTIQLTYAECEKICNAAEVRIDPSAGGIRTALSKAIAYDNQNILIASIELLDNGDIRCVVDDDEGALEKIADFIDIQSSRIFLTPHTDTPTYSDKDNLYLYREGEKLFYYFDQQKYEVANLEKADEHDIIDLFTDQNLNKNVLDLLESKEEKQLKACKALLKITSERGHTLAKSDRLTYVKHPNENPIIQKYDEEEINAYGFSAASDKTCQGASMVITPAMQEILYASVSKKDEFLLPPLLAGARLQKALSSELKINVLTLGNSKGDYTVYFEDKADKEKLEKFYKGKKYFCHLTRSMERSFKKHKSIQSPGDLYTTLKSMGISLDFNGYNGYIMTGDEKSIAPIKEIHKLRYDSLPAVKLTKKQVEILCATSESKLDESEIKKIGLRAALMKVIDYTQHNIPTAFLEITKEGDARLVVEAGPEGIDRLAGILKVTPQSLTAGVCHPKDDRAEQLKQIRVAPPVKKGPDFPTAANFSNKDFPAIFTFKDQKVAENLYNQLIKKNKKDYITLGLDEKKNMEIKFSPQACSDDKVREFLNLFDYEKNTIAKRAASYLALRARYVQEYYLHPSIFRCCRSPVSRSLRCKGAWDEIIINSPSLPKQKVNKEGPLAPQLLKDIAHFDQIKMNKK